MSDKRPTIEVHAEVPTPDAVRTFYEVPDAVASQIGVLDHKASFVENLVSLLAGKAYAVEAVNVAAIHHVDKMRDLRDQHNSETRKDCESGCDTHRTCREDRGPCTHGLTAGRGTAERCLECGEAVGEMQDARIAADDRVAALDDLVQRAWSLIAGAMSGNPHKPTANSEWMDAAHAWEIDYCMGQGSSVPEYPTVSYRVRDRDSDYKAMCHEDRDHAELLLKAWLADGRDAVIESRVVYDAGWTPLAVSAGSDGEDR